MTAEIFLSDEETPEESERSSTQQRVLEMMGWTTKNYFEVVRLLLRRREVDVESLDKSERQAYFEIHQGLAAAFKSVVPPAQFGFLGGRKNKIPAADHARVREEVQTLLSEKISKPEAYSIVGRNWNNASPATVKRICEDRTRVRGYRGRGSTK